MFVQHDAKFSKNSLKSKLGCKTAIVAATSLLNIQAHYTTFSFHSITSWNGFEKMGVCDTANPPTHSKNRYQLLLSNTRFSPHKRYLVGQPLQQARVGQRLNYKFSVALSLLQTPVSCSNFYPSTTVVLPRLSILIHLKAPLQTLSSKCLA